MVRKRKVYPLNQPSSNKYLVTETDEQNNQQLFHTLKLEGFSINEDTTFYKVKCNLCHCGGRIPKTQGTAANGVIASQQIAHNPSCPKYFKHSLSTIEGRVARIEGKLGHSFAANNNVVIEKLAVYGFYPVAIDGAVETYQFQCIECQQDLRILSKQHDMLQIELIQKCEEQRQQNIHKTSCTILKSIFDKQVPESRIFNKTPAQSFVNVPMCRSRTDARVEQGLAYGAFFTAGATTSGLVTSSTATPTPNIQTHPEMFEHIHQGDVPLSQLVIFAQHNAESVIGKGSLPLIATNQHMGIMEALEKTPIRGFELDIYKHNNQLVLNHGGLFDPSVSENNIPKLDDVLINMNNWLHQGKNSHEVIFLATDNANVRLSNFESVFGFGRVMRGRHYNAVVQILGREPTIKDLREFNFTVVLFDKSEYVEAGKGTLHLGSMEITNYWENQNALTALRDLGTNISVGGRSTADIAPPLTTDRVDAIVNGNQGAWLSLDQVSPNDPRCLKPEDREAFYAKTGFIHSGAISWR